MSQSNRNTVTRETCCLEPMESRQLLAAHFGLDAALDGLVHNDPSLAIHAEGLHESASRSRGISPMSVQPFEDPGAASLQPRLIVGDGDIAVLLPQPGSGAVAISVRSGELTYFNNGWTHQALSAEQSPWQFVEYGEAHAYRSYRGPAPRSTNGNSRPTPRDNSDSDSYSDPSARSVANDVSSAAVAASTTVNMAASGATGVVARSIFSSEPVNSQTTTTPVRAVPAAVAAAAGTTMFQSLWAGRAVRVYASVLPHDFAPMAVEAQGVVAAVRVMADAPAASADLAVSAAVHALPAPRQVLQFARIGSPFMLLADSVGEFIQESAAMTGISQPTSAAQHQRAWMITFSVIAADVAMLSYYFHTRRKTRLGQSLQPIGLA
jgi:hypothetical protein